MVNLMLYSNLVWIDSDDKVKVIRRDMIVEAILVLCGTILFFVILVSVGLWYLSILLIIPPVILIKYTMGRYPQPLEIYTDKLVYWYNLASGSEGEHYEKRIVHYHDIEYVSKLNIEEINIPIIDKVIKKWISIKLKSGKEVILSGRYVTQIEFAHFHLKRQYDAYQQFTR